MDDDLDLEEDMDEDQNLLEYMKKLREDMEKTRQEIADMLKRTMDLIRPAATVNNGSLICNTCRIRTKVLYTGGKCEKCYFGYTQPVFGSRLSG